MSEYAGHDDIIYPWQVDERIKRLQNMKMDSDLNEDGELELELCLQFRQDVIDTGGSESHWTDSPGFVADAYFSKYCDDHAADIFGRAVVDLPYWDQDSYEDDQRDELFEIDFDGATYLIDKEV